MKNLITTIFLLLLSASLHCELPFEIERYGTDYIGIAKNDKTVLLYGKYGIITYTHDAGQNWRQVCIGDDYDVLKVISVWNVFYALTTNSVFVSHDDGETWERHEILGENPWLDFSTDGNNFYLISKTELYKVGKELKDKELLFQFENFISLTEIARLGKYLFIVDAGIAIYRYDTETNQIDDTIYVGSGTQPIERLKVEGSTLYALLRSEHSASYEDKFNVVRHSVLKSTDLGKSWETVTRDLPVTKDFIVEGKYVATLSPKVNTSFNVVATSYVVADTTGLVREEVVFDTSNVFIPYFGIVDNVFNDFYITCIERINDNVIIAEGVQKSIMLSVDNGKTWNVVSYFRPLYKPFIFPFADRFMPIGNDTLIIFSDLWPFVFYSFDGGATFKSLSVARALELVNIGLNDFGTFIGRDGKFGWVVVEKEKKYKLTGNLILVYSKDWGRTFERQYISLNSVPSFSKDSVIFILFTSAKYFNEIGRISIPFEIYQDNQQNLIGHLIIDEDCNFVDTIFSPYLLTANPFRLLGFWDERNIYTVITDSQNTIILRTVDFGRNWIAFDTIPRVGYKKSDTDFMNFTLEKILGNGLYVIRMQVPGKGFLVLYDSKKKTFDSLETPFYYGLYYWGNMVFVVSQDKVIIVPDITKGLVGYYETDFPEKFQRKQKYELLDILERGGKDFLIVGKIYGDLLSDNYEINLCKIRKRGGISSVVEMKDEENPYLFVLPLYPNPAKDFVVLPFFWEPGYSVDDVKISIYDINGNLCTNYIKSYSPTSANAGAIRVECGNFPEGIYFLSAKIFDRNYIMPFLKIK